MSKLGPHFLCTGHHTLFVKSGALVAATSWFHCMKIFTFAVGGTYHSGSVSLQAHIFWISEQQAALCLTQALVTGRTQSQSPQMKTK